MPYACDVDALDRSARPVGASHAAPLRWGLAVLGLLFVGLGAVGVLLPGLPTTPFLLLASFCFTRSFPRLGQRLLRSRLFGPYMRLLEGDEPLSLRTRVIAASIVWVAVTLSLVGLEVGGTLTWPLATVIVVAAVIGTAVIALFRRRPRA